MRLSINSVRAEAEVAEFLPTGLFVPDFLVMAVSRFERFKYIYMVLEAMASPSPIGTT